PRAPQATADPTTGYASAGKGHYLRTIDRHQPAQRPAIRDVGLVPAHALAKRQASDASWQGFGQHLDGRAPGLVHHRSHVLPAFIFHDLQFSDRHTPTARKTERCLGGATISIEGTIGRWPLDDRFAVGLTARQTEH